MHQYVVLEIDRNDLEIYCGDPETRWNVSPYRIGDRGPGWQRSPFNRFIWDHVGKRYSLLRTAEKGPYKFLVHLRPGQDFEGVERTVEAAGYIITGSGDYDPQTGYRRLWFYDPRQPTEGAGVWTNNVL